MEEEGGSPLMGVLINVKGDGPNFCLPSLNWKRNVSINLVKPPGPVGKWETLANFYLVVK